MLASLINPPPNISQNIFTPQMSIVAAEKSVIHSKPFMQMYTKSSQKTSPEIADNFPDVLICYSNFKVTDRITQRNPV